MEYFKDTLCISYDDLVRNDALEGMLSDAVMSRSNYLKLCSNGTLKVIRPGKGKGCYALIEVSSLPDRFLHKVKIKYPQGMNVVLHKWFDDTYTIDTAAREYYSTEVYRANGSHIDTKVQRQYTINASVLNALIELSNNLSMRKRAMGNGGRMNWEEISEAVEYFRVKVGHTLPASRIQDVMKRYKEGGYGALVSRKYCNQSARKVSANIEQLIISLAVQPTNPYNNTIMELFNQFMHGEIDVVDTTTGELFSPEDFYKNGEPIQLSHNTIWNYVNNPKNRILIENQRQSWTMFNHSIRPYMHRKSPYFAFSKISLDDRDLPRKCHSGIRPKAYYAYDVASGCVIGYAYSLKKDADLFIGCLRNMFQLIDRNGWGVPAEAEVENHLVRQYEDDLMRAGTVFPFVRWCAPTNSQEKRAEHFNKAKKYGVEKNNHTGIGRWWMKLSANRIYDQKVFDEKNNTYKEKTYEYEELIADDMADIYEYNNQKHPNQVRYPGMTRWEVLCQNQNPTLKPYNKAVLYKMIGEVKTVSIHRNQSVHVDYRDFWLSSPELVSRLAPNTRKVQAYYLPDASGSFDTVYIYQGENYIGVCQYMPEYQEAKAEQTEDDKLIFTEQNKYVSRFNKMVKDGKPAKVEVIRKERKAAVEMALQATPVEIHIPKPEPIERENDIYINADWLASFAKKAMIDL